MEPLIASYHLGRNPSHDATHVDRAYRLMLLFGKLCSYACFVFVIVLTGGVSLFVNEPNAAAVDGLCEGSNGRER